MQYNSLKYRSRYVHDLMIEILKKDEYTFHHCINVAKYTKSLAEILGCKSKETIFYSALYHDVGKLMISSSILNKPDRLTHYEFEIMKSHCQFSKKILKAYELPDEVCNIVLCHHERLDGSGYPNGLTSALIPIEAQIISVCDCFDAMTTKRCYRDPMTAEQAINELYLNSHQFNTMVLNKFAENIDSIVDTKQLITSPW